MLWSVAGMHRKCCCRKLLAVGSEFLAIGDDLLALSSTMVNHTLGEFGVAKSENLSRKNCGIGGASCADANGSHRDARWHLNRGQQGIKAIERLP